MRRLGVMAIICASGLGLPVASPGLAGAAAPGGPAEGGGALAVLGDFALGLAREPVLLGAVLGGLLLLFLSGVGLGHRQAWLRPPAPLRSPSLARAAEALQAAPSPARGLDVRRAHLAVAAGRPLLFSVGYEIRPERREEYLAYMDGLRDHLVRELGYAYAVWEQDGRPNWFTEMILCTTPQEFNRLAGPDDSVTRRLMAGLNQFLRDPDRVRRTTLMGMAPAAMAARPASETVMAQPGAVPEPYARSVPIPRTVREAPPGALPAEAA